MGALSQNAITLLSRTTGINAKSVAVTELYVVPAGRTLIMNHVMIGVTNFVSGGKAVQAIASFGGNDPTYDDYINSVTYTVSAASTYIRDTVATAVPMYAAGTSFRISIETGSDATTETWAVDVFGYLI